MVFWLVGCCCDEHFFLLKTIFERLFLFINAVFSNAVYLHFRCLCIYLSVAFDFEHTIKNFAISGLRLRVTINSLLLYLDFMLTGNP